MKTTDLDGHQGNGAAPICSYDSGAATDCVPLCDTTATHVVIHRNGSYGPFESPVCRQHLGSMQGRVYPGLIDAKEL